MPRERRSERWLPAYIPALPCIMIDCSPFCRQAWHCALGCSDEGCQSRSFLQRGGPRLDGHARERHAAAAHRNGCRKAGALAPRPEGHPKVPLRGFRRRGRLHGTHQLPENPGFEPPRQDTRGQAQVGPAPAAHAKLFAKPKYVAVICGDNFHVFLGSLPREPLASSSVDSNRRLYKIRCVPLAALAQEAKK